MFEPRSHRGIQNIPDREVHHATYLNGMDWLIALDNWQGDTKHLPTMITYLKEHYGLTHYWATVVAAYYLIKRMGN